MRTQLSNVRANSIRPLLAAALGFALSFTFNACGEQDRQNDDASSPSGKISSSSSARVSSSSKPSSSSIEPSSSSSLAGQSSSGKAKLYCYWPEVEEYGGSSCVEMQDDDYCPVDIGWAQVVNDCDSTTQSSSSVVPSSSSVLPQSSGSKAKLYCYYAGPITTLACPEIQNADECEGDGQVVNDCNSIPKPDPPIGAPTGLTAKANSDSSIVISWSSVKGATVYRIYRNHDDPALAAHGVYNLVGTSETTTYTDVDLGANRTYFYKVAAYNNDFGESPWSNIVSATTFADAIRRGTFTDSRDGKIYKWVKHGTNGTKTWMAENLNYNASGSKCYGEGFYAERDGGSGYLYTLSDAEVQSNCVKYGRLYDWATAMALPSRYNSENYCSSQICSSPHQGICPTGWHLPSRGEWTDLLNYVDLNGKDYTYSNHIDYTNRDLKATSGWNDCDGKSGNGTDAFGFSALPGGMSNRNTLGQQSFINVGKASGWWAAYDSDSKDNAVSRGASCSDGSGGGSGAKYILLSVRCVKD